MTTGLAKLRNFSVTQYRAFNPDLEGGCKRKWWFQTIAKMRGPRTEALERGTHVHDLIKGLIQGAPDPVDDPYLVFAKAVSAHFPAQNENFLVEHGLSLETHLGLPWTGYVDLFRYELPTPILIDWKTTSSIRKYGLAPADLYDDIQVNAYGHYGWTEGLSAPVIRAGLVYVELPKHDDVLRIADGRRKKPFAPKVMSVFIDLRRENAERVWASTRPILDQMVEVAACESAQDVEPNTQSCDSYGGCPFRKECGLSVRAKNATELAMARWISKRTKPDDQPGEKEEEPMAFMDKVRASAAAKAAAAGQPPTNGAPKTNGAPAPAKAPPAAAQAAKPAPAAASRFAKKAAPAAAQEPEAQVPTGVVPPDAPPRDTRDVVETAPEETAAVEEPKKRGRPKKTEGAAPAASTAKSFVIYQDCLPVKGGEEIVTSLEDWWGPIAMQLDEHALAEKNLPSHWLMEFGEQKALVSLAVREQIAERGLPKAMHVSTSSAIARDLLPLLIPHATLVVKQTRG